MPNIETRRKFLRTAAVATAATALPGVPAIAGEVDPIFAAIEAHRRTAQVDTGPSIKEGELWSDVYNQACIALLSTEPTSLAGAAAVLDYVNQPEWDDSIATSILVETSYNSADPELKQAARDFLPMIAGVVRNATA